MRFEICYVRSLHSSISPNRASGELAKYKSGLVIVQKVRREKGVTEPADLSFSMEVKMLIAT